MWGIIPAAGAGNRIQPLAFSKELLPVGSRIDDGSERPRAVSEYLVERMIRGGANKLCFVISPGKGDILHYYGSRLWGADIMYAVQPQPGGLCDAVFRARPFIAADESVIIGLPDTVWFPEDALQQLPDDVLSFLLFPVEQPQFFDAVLTDGTTMFAKSRSNIRTPARTGSGEHSRCPATSFTISTNCGAGPSVATNTLEPSSTHGSRPAAGLRQCEQEKAMLTWVHCTAIALPSACSKKQKSKAAIRRRRRPGGATTQCNRHRFTLKKRSAA